MNHCEWCDKQETEDEPLQYGSALYPPSEPESPVAICYNCNQMDHS